MKIHRLFIALTVLVSYPFGCLAQNGNYKSETVDGVTNYYDKYFEIEITPAELGEITRDDTLPSLDFDRKSSNAENFYYRACVLWFARSQAKRNALFENLNSWQQCEIEKFPKEEVAQTLAEFQPVLEQVQRASQRRNCNWDFDLENMDFLQYISMDLYELHTLRSISQVLQLRTRLEIARGDFQAAEESISQHVKLGTDVGKIPFLVAGIVGESIISTALQSSIELGSQKNAPNQYHALQSLPNPAINFFPMARTETYLVGKSFPILYTPEKLQLTNEEWRDLYSDALRTVDVATGRQVGDEKDSERESRAALLLARLYPIAKRELISSGWDEKKINEMPVGQVVAIQTRRVWDQYTGLLNRMQPSPWPVAEEVRERIIENIESQGYDVPGRRGDFPITDLAPPLLDVDLLPSNARLINRQIAMMQIVAQLRHYATTHGKLPDRQEFQSLNLIKDPRTGEPFEYTPTSDSTAVLQTQTLTNPNDPSYRKINILMKIHLEN